MSLVDRCGPWALITGAANGIGAAYAAELGARGLRLLLLDRDEAALDALCRRLGATAVPLDLRAPDLLERLEPYLDGREVGLLVNNAGIATVGPLVSARLPAELEVVDVNVRATLALTWRLLPAMVDRGRGGLVFVSSVAALNGGPRLATYVATKAWIASFADSLAAELAPHGVWVQCVFPGMTRTDALAGSMDLAAVRTPILEPGDVARASIDGLGRHAAVVPGWINQLSSTLSRFVLPRRMRHRLMGRARPLKPS